MGHDAGLERPTIDAERGGHSTIRLNELAASAKSFWRSSRPTPKTSEQMAARACKQAPGCHVLALLGAALGTLVGYGVPLLHYRDAAGRSKSSFVELRAVPAPGGVRVLGRF